MSDQWRKVVLDILKYAVGAVIGAAGLSFAGCACVPCFNF